MSFEFRIELAEIMDAVTPLDKGDKTKAGQPSLTPSPTNSWIHLGTDNSLAFQQLPPKVAEPMPKAVESKPAILSEAEDIEMISSDHALSEPIPDWRSLRLSVSPAPPESTAEFDMISLSAVSADSGDLQGIRCATPSRNSLSHPEEPISPGKMHCSRSRRLVSPYHSGQTAYERISTSGIAGWARHYRLPLYVASNLVIFAIGIFIGRRLAPL